jgi:hypothetical protein
MPHYAIAMTDGSVAVMVTVGDAGPANEIAKWHDDERTRVASVTPLDPADIPADRTFRNAWRLNGTGIDHDMEKARAIQRERMRLARAPLLAALDVEYQRADEAADADAKASVAARKQALRDAPQDPRVDTVQTVEALKTVWPDALSG